MVVVVSVRLRMVHAAEVGGKGALHIGDLARPVGLACRDHDLSEGEFTAAMIGWRARTIRLYGFTEPSIRVSMSTSNLDGYSSWPARFPKSATAWVEGELATHLHRTDPRTIGRLHPLQRAPTLPPAGV